MSKLGLKKELLMMTHEQLVEIILNAYSARKEFKDYFEFFLNPDVEKVFDKSVEAIKKEASRSKRGYAKFRISNIRKIIKNFEGLNPGAEYTLKLMMIAVRFLALFTKLIYFSHAQDQSVIKLAKDTLLYGDKHGLITDVFSNFSKLATDEMAAAPYFRNHVLDILNDFHPDLHR